jgi:hypothetical protein
MAEHEKASLKNRCDELERQINCRLINTTPLRIGLDEGLFFTAN